MEDPTVIQEATSSQRMPLGMSSFGPEERQKLGNSLRLAMAFIESPPEQQAQSAANPLDVSTIKRRLLGLTEKITSQHAEQLDLLVTFDDVQGWKNGGASHCAAWMNLELGIGPQLGWEYLRTGRSLRSLPVTAALFKAGKLSWSKVRIITRVADKDNEKLLCQAALDASVTQVKRLCDEYRWKDEDNGEADNKRAMRQWESRALRWDETSNGSTRIQLILPPDMAQAFLNSVEHSLHHIEGTEDKMSQRRADAAVLMAESSLQSAGRDIATADRYQVVVSVDAAELTTFGPRCADANGGNHCGTTDVDTIKTSACNSNATTSECFPRATCTSGPAVTFEATSTTTSSQKTDIPTKRAVIKGAGPIAKETAKRLACDCSICIIGTSDGEPVNIGRKSRIWPAPMARAIKNRDHHCQFPGCTHTRNLQIHHIKHWADNGETSLDNGVCVCAYHHTYLHEGGYSIQRVENDKVLSDDEELLNSVRKLSPSRYRFRVVDEFGKDIREVNATSISSYSTRVEYEESKVREHVSEYLPRSSYTEFLCSSEYLGPFYH